MPGVPADPVTGPSAEPQAVAERAARRLLASDGVPAELGLVLDHVAPGTATVSMLPLAWMINGASIVHGGMIFTLADQAFGFASNSHGPLAVGAGCAIRFRRPAFAGRRLVATAVEEERTAALARYAVAVHDEDGRLVAEFTGEARPFTAR